jgi:hypothetical protein|tara:strand:- start:284 stop:598 length:315 start_codon:yes stop_codon:yes gene_type:complete
MKLNGTSLYWSDPKRPKTNRNKMSDKWEMPEFEYDPERNKEVVAVVDVNIGGVVYHVPCEDYDEAIQEGRTEFVIKDDHVQMVSPEQLEHIKKAIAWLKEEKRK